MSGRGIGGHHRGYRGGTDTWLTPPDLLARLGTFDVDPCAAIGQPWRTATVQYTEREDGMAQPWRGRVWLNPPYGPQTHRWLDRLLEHGDGIALVFARTDTEGFQRVARRADAVLFIAGRLHFHHVDGRRADANAGGPSCLLAFGARNVEALAESGIDGFTVRHAGALLPQPQSLFARGAA